MPTLGQTFKAAREKKKVTCSQAAAATRLKVQHVEAMERDDFSRAAAPMYAKGFIKIYAEYLGLDPAPFIQEYVELHGPKERAPILAEDAPPPKKPIITSPGETFKPWDLARILEILRRSLRPLAIGGGVLVLALFLLSAVNRCSRRVMQPPAANAPAAREAERAPLPVVLEPPEPYVEAAAAPAQKP